MVATLWVAKLIIDRVAAAGHPRAIDAQLLLLIGCEFLLAVVVMVCGRGVDFCKGRIANRILVLDEGVIREEGTHEELLARRGFYSEMFHVQASNYQ